MSLPDLPTVTSANEYVQSATVRRNLRFAPDANTPPMQFMNSAGRAIHCVLVNESYSGVAATVDAVDGIKVGQETMVSYFGRPMAGIVRRVIEQPKEGNWLIGIEWK